MAFKRASLNGSAQLFQPTRVARGRRESAPAEPVPPETRPASEERPASWEEPGPEMVARRAEVASLPLPHGHLYRLTDDDIELLMAALQHAKFPHSYQRLPKPPLEEFEQLEALRQKISDQREGSV